MAESLTKFMATARKRAKLAHEAEKEERDKALEDLKFLDGEQWDSDLRTDREGDGRPCLTINKLPEKQDQVVGDQRQNRPAIKVKPVDSQADPETAKIIEGLIRNIEATSFADIAYDHAFEHASSCGEGHFQILTAKSEWEFDQDLEPLQYIEIAKIDNSFSVLWDPKAVKYDRSDAGYAFIISDIPRDSFKSEHRGKKELEFNEDLDDDTLKGWAKEDTVRIAEYFVKEDDDRTVYLWQDGTITFKDREDEEPVKTRTVTVPMIKWYKISGLEILEGPVDIPGRYIPIVPVWGKELNVGGKRKKRGLVRHAKDPQRAYNYSRSSEIEITALAPKHPYLATAQMIGPYETVWQNAHRKNYPYMLFEPDERVAGGRPAKESPAQIPSGEAHLAAVADGEIKSTTGIYDASLGAKSNETSGKAILARQKEGDVATFAYIDNLARSIRQAGRILVHMIPDIYDTERIIQVTNEDGTDKPVTVNGVNVDPATGEQDVDENGLPRIYDLTAGRYDVTVTVGPSFSTQRAEAAESMGQMISQVPDSFKMISDLYVKAQDWPGAAEISERFKRTIPPELLDEKTGQLLDPAQVKQMIEQAVAEYAQSLEAQEKEAKIDTERAKAEQIRAETERDAIETESATQRIVAETLEALRARGGLNG